MALITIKVHGNFNHTEKFFKRMKSREYLKVLENAGQRGVEALASATPVHTGLTASSWTYEIERSFGKAAIYWSNTNVNQGVSIAVIIQVGHGTKNGGYVAPIDYINPAMRSVFQNIADDLWKEVTSA